MREIINVKPSPLYLKRLRAKIEDMSDNELRALRVEVLANRLGFLPLLEFAIDEILKERECKIENK